MKSVYNHLKEPIAHCLKKDTIKEGVKIIDALTSQIKPLKIEDKIDINSNNQLYKQQVFTYKPSLIQQKINNNLNHDNCVELNNSTQFGIKKVGLTNLVYEQFSTKADRMTKFADPTNDVAFKKIFSQDNIEGIKDFVESIVRNAKDFPFPVNFTSIEFLNKDHMPSVIQGKKSLCDLKVKDDKGNTYIIEMQKRNEQDYLQRIQYYSAHAVTDQLEQGIDHAELNPVITISIMPTKCFNSDVPCISYHPFKETVTNKQLLNAQSHIFVELPKLEKSDLKESTLEWLQMFKNAPKLEHTPDVKSTYVKKAYERLEQHNWSSEEKKAYINVKIADDIEKYNIKHAVEEGIEKSKNTIAKGLKDSGVKIDIISKTTGLTEDQIEKL